ncbi:MAG: AbrB/MazE/SpoVT family DNA-binding domain-containing protein [Clostridia bacterium]|nr:AbrB/MazE/SpoVT family DNA-binding domain-containing protein [Clostridia bacterium]
MTANIQKWGNSQGIRLPKTILELLHWKDNEVIEITAENDTIVIKKAKNKRRSIQELFEGFEGKYEHIEMNWGEPTGEELW